MNLGNEVIVKNFHVLSGAHIVTKVEKDGKVYFKITKSDGTTPDAENQRVTTDQFCLESIKRIRLTMPEAPKFKKWEITAPTLTISAGEHKLLTVYMHFTNLYGYGITDRWEKFATISVGSATTKKQIAFDLAERINAQYIQGNKPIIAKAYDVTVSSNTYTQITTRPSTADASGHAYKVVIEDNTYAIQTPTRRRMEIGADPQPVQMYITTNILEGDDVSWATEVSTANAAKKSYEGVVDSTKTYKNDYLIWGLEKVSQLNSTESMADPCTGFIGYDSVMDNESLNTANYYVLDIAYETLPKMGVPSGRNLKELSFAAVAGTGDVVPTVLTDILAELGAANYTPTVATPVATRGTGANKNKVTVTCATEGATIRYTTNGDVPTSGSTAYENTVTLTSGQTFKAKAYKNGYEASAVSNAIAYEA